MGTVIPQGAERAECTEPFKALKIDEVEAGKSQVAVYRFRDPPKMKHITRLLEGVVLPDPEIMVNEFEEQDKRFFGGSFMVRQVQKALAETEKPGAGFQQGGFYNQFSQRYNANFNNNRAVNLPP